MKVSKNKVSVALAVTGLVISGGAFAMPGLSDGAPDSSIKLCIAQISEQANYENAGRVRHVVDSKERRSSGHTIMIDTIVFDAGGDQVLREYRTVCAVSDNSTTQRFKIKEKSL